MTGVVRARNTARFASRHEGDLVGQCDIGFVNLELLLRGRDGQFKLAAGAAFGGATSGKQRRAAAVRNPTRGGAAAAGADHGCLDWGRRLQREPRVADRAAGALDPSSSVRAAAGSLRRGGRIAVQSGSRVTTAA